MKLCTICQKPIVLVPSATERAQKYGGTPAYYESLFREHSECVLARRAEHTSALMKRVGTDEVIAAQNAGRPFSYYFAGFPNPRVHPYGPRA